MVKNVLLAFALCASVKVAAQDQTVIVNPVEPIHYENSNGEYKILSYIKTKDINQKKLRAVVCGKDAKISTTTKGDSVLVWLPMIGEEGEIKVYSGKKLLVNQAFRPIIPSDWGYFKNGTIHIIQSSHQDIAWMNTPDSCREDRIEKIINPALEIMKENKNFKFEMEQTLNLMEFLEKYPEKKDELITLYKEGRFNWGATFNQPYEGLASGEQLIRQAYYGRKWITENLPGCDDRVANNMDVPGRTWQMPQILAKSGIPYLYVSRMGEGFYDWYSPDGSKVLTVSPGNYGWATLMWKFFSKDGAYALNKLHHRSQIWSDYYKAHNIPPHYEILMSCDATKPADYQKVIDEWNHIAETANAELPRLTCSTAEAYFKAIHSDKAVYEKIEGERPNLWLYIHGPAHYDETRYKRQAGVLLPAAETFTSIAKFLDNELASYPRAAFDRAWMASIYPDHGLGGKHGDITDSIYADSLKLARDMGQEMLNQSLEVLAEKINTPKGNWVVFNDLTWSRNKNVVLPIAKNKAVVKDAQGKAVPSQVVSKDGKNYVTFHAQEVPSMGYRTYRVEEGKNYKASLNALHTTNNSIENAYYKAILGKGGIVSLYDKELQKDLSHTSKFAFGDIIELSYNGNGAGEFTRITDVVPGDVTPLSSFDANWKMTENGPLYTRFENEVPTKNATIVQVITFSNINKQIDFDITLRDFNGAHNRQYRVCFPTNMMTGNTIHYEVPMGVAQVGKDEMKQKPMGWAWGGSYVHNPVDTHPREIQNFMSVSGNGYGLTMSSCVAVCDWIDPSREGASYPILQGILLSSHHSCHGEGNWYHQTGTHHFHVAITSHKEDWKNGYHFGVAENHPFHVVQKTNKGGELDKTHSFVEISDPFVTLSLIKKADADNNLIIRLTEMEGKDKTVTVTLPVSAKKIVKTNLVEEEEETLPIHGKTISLKLGHHAIETFKIVL